MRNIQLIFVVALFLASHTQAAELTIAFWNVENLFDTQDDPKVEGDEEFTPAGPKEWSNERLQIKLDNLSRVIKEFGDGKGPDVLGVCEIENRAVLEMLVKKLAPLGRDYRIIHQDSPSARGIDCALLHDAKVVKLKEQPRFHEVSGSHTRDVVEVPLRWEQADFTVMVNHWPSQLNPESARVQAATVVRKRVDELLRQDPESDFLLIGDFNEAPSAEALTKNLRTWGESASLRPGVLFNSMWSLYSGGKAGTYVYQNKWNVLDQVILSPGMLNSRGVKWVPESSVPFKKDFMMFVPKSTTQMPRPSRSYSGNRFHPDGYSDHLPIICRITK